MCQQETSARSQTRSRNHQAAVETLLRQYRPIADTFGATIARRRGSRGARLEKRIEADGVQMGLNDFRLSFQPCINRVPTFARCKWADYD
jgi:hypothetical protein